MTQRQLDNDRFYLNSNGVWVPSGTTVLPSPNLKKWAADCAVECLYEPTVRLVRAAAEMGMAGKSDATALGFAYAIAQTNARKEYRRQSKLAAGFGTFIHWMCEQTLTNGDVLVIPDTWTVPDEEPWRLEVDVELTKKFMYGFDYKTKSGKKKYSPGLIDWIRNHNVKVIATEYAVVTDTYGGRLDLVCELDGEVTLVDFKTGKGTYYPTWKYQLAGYRQAWNKMMPHRPITRHGILQFNKETMRVNYKDFTKYQTTRTNPKTLEKEKYTRTYETDRDTFNSLVRNWWLVKRGIEI